jgi:hypothetical protein
MDALRNFRGLNGEPVNFFLEKMAIGGAVPQGQAHD